MVTASPTRDYSLLVSTHRGIDRMGWGTGPPSIILDLSNYLIPSVSRGSYFSQGFQNSPFFICVTKAVRSYIKISICLSSCFLSCVSHVALSGQLELLQIRISPLGGLYCSFTDASVFPLRLLVILECRDSFMDSFSCAYWQGCVWLLQE